MKKIKAVTDMKIYRYNKIVPLFLAFLFISASGIYGQNRDKLPAEFREYTNPEEIVRFDRTIPFTRALDVINQFAQKFRGKVVINRTEVTGEIGISVPAMHWMDALKLILRVKKLHLVEQEEFFEIVTRESLQAQTTAQAPQTGGGGGGQGQDGEGPVATTQTHEVRINAIFFEGNRRALQEIGVDWSTISENVPDAILGGGQGGQGGGQGGGGQGGQGGGQSIPNSQFGDGPFVQVNSKGAANVSQDVFNSLINIGEIGNTGIEVQALFSAFEADNLGEILASPTIKVMDGQLGRIQVGQDFSIKQRDIAGNVVEEFFSVGTILEVTPQVVEQRDTTFIHLDIIANRSTAQPDPVSTIINKQEAQTQALLLDGEATVIAGLYNTEKAEVRRGVPILKDLPPWFFGLRYLFGYSSKDYQMRELVILLQASLEPSIPERYEKEDYRNKYEVLQDERDRMMDEIETAERLMNDKSPNLDEKEEEESEEPAAENPDTTSQNQEMSEKPEQNEEQKMTAEKDDTTKQEMNTKNEQKEKEAPAISDPEVQTKKVQLDLGGSDSTSEEAQNQNEQSKAMPDTSSQESVNKMENNQQSESEMVKNSDKTYYLIGGSFKVEENAKDLKNELQNNGFNAVVINMQGSDIKLVAYRGYDDLGSAKTGLADVQQNQNSEAWLYKAK